MSALLGYFCKSNGAFEGVPLDHTWPRMVAMMRGGGNLLWIAGGILTGPLYGYFGHRWRVARSWVAAVLVSCALCLEPFARHAIGDRLVGGLSGSPVVWTAEVFVGIVIAAAFVWTIFSDRRARGAVDTR